MPSQLSPFNVERFDQCMLWFMNDTSRKLTQYQMVKLHFMTDAFHVLEYGVPVIGGKASPWPKGPVVQDAYDHIMDAARTGGRGAFRVRRRPGIKNAVYEFSPGRAKLRPKSFSQSELQAMERAKGAVFGRHKGEGGKDYFHDVHTFVGKAYLKADEEGRNIDWLDVVAAYDDLNHTDHSSSKGIIAFQAQS